MKLSKLLWGVFSIVFLLKALETFSFIDYYDPFAYHLAMPRIWYETSFLETLRENDLFLLAGVFDYLFIIPMYLTGGDFFLSLKFSQFLHYFCSIGLGAFLLGRIFKNTHWAPLAGICLLTISKGATFFLVAKNDGVVSLLTLFSFILIFDETFLKNLKGYKRGILIGVSMGLIPAVKLNGLLYLVPLSIYFILKNRKSFKLILLVSFTALLTLIPILIKNWIFIKNPLFPALLSVFPGESTAEMRQFYSKFVGSDFKLELLGKHLSYFLMGKAFFIIALPLLVFKVYRKDKLCLKSNYVPVLLAASSYMIYILINGGLPTYRFVFPGYFLLCFFIFNELRKNEVIFNKNWIVFGILIFILADSKVDKSVKSIKKLSMNWSLTSEEIVEKEFPYSTFWKYIEVEEKAVILSDYLTNSYFSKEGTRVRCGLVDREASKIFSCPNTKYLKNYSYALLKEERSNNCYKLIRSEGKALHQINGVTLYDIRGITSVSK